MRSVDPLPASTAMEICESARGAAFSIADMILSARSADAVDAAAAGSIVGVSAAVGV